MANRAKSRERLEPRFGEFHDSGEDLRLDESDRISGTSRKKSSLKQDPLPKDSQPKKQREKRAPKTRNSVGITGLIGRLFYWSVVMSIWGAVAIAGILVYYGSQMPSASTWTIPDRPPNLKIVASDGSLLANRGTTGGEALALEDMSPYLPQAVIAIEDRRFHSHLGVDPFGLARAMATNLTNGRMVQGGSTITQQLAKNLFLSPERTIERKIQELLLSFWLEHKFSKDQIMAMYLNRVFFGSNAYGVEAASQRYFGKSARDVNLGEAAVLAGLLKAPSRLSPARDPQAAEERGQVVLQAMHDVGFITEREIKLAMSQPPTQAKRYWSGAEHYAADMVLEEVKSLIAEIKSDLTVDTTIDPILEKAAEAAISQAITNEGDKLNVQQGALVSIDGNGAIKAIVGGVDYSLSQFNRAVKAKRQPGSAFKPFVYIAAMENGVTPYSIRNDAPVKIGKWTPENYDQKYRGEVSIAQALATSLNTIAAQLVMEVGPDRVTQVAHRMGIESELQSNASIALGTSEVSLLELTASYAPLMNGGYKATPHIVKRITNSDGQVIYENKYDNPPKILSESIAAEMNMMLMGVVTEGTGKAAQIPGWQVAGKSGTTQSFRDALFVGYTSQLTTGIWFGNDEGQSMKKVTGGGLPARTWKEFMGTAVGGLSPSPLFGLGFDQSQNTPSTGIEQPDTVMDMIKKTVDAIPLPSEYPVATEYEVYPDPPIEQPNPYPPIQQSSPSWSDGPIPPAEIGQRSNNPNQNPRETTLYDFLMGN